MTCDICGHAGAVRRPIRVGREVRVRHHCPDPEACRKRLAERQAHERPPVLR